MNIHKEFPSRYLAAHELSDRDWTLTMKSVVKEEMGAPPDTTENPVLYFVGAKKGMALNKTNANVIAGLYGFETDNWVNKTITIYATQINAFGRVCDVIRVRPQKPPDKDRLPDQPPEEPLVDDEGNPYEDELASATEYVNERPPLPPLPQRFEAELRAIQWAKDKDIDGSTAMRIYLNARKKVMDGEAISTDDELARVFEQYTVDVAKYEETLLPSSIR